MSHEITGTIKHITGNRFLLIDRKKNVPYYKLIVNIINVKNPLVYGLGQQISITAEWNEIKGVWVEC